MVFGAGTKNRTRDLLITNQLLYQLSYAGNVLLTSSKNYLITVNVGFLTGFSATASAWGGASAAIGPDPSAAPASG